LCCGDVDVCALSVVIFVQGSWEGYAPSDQRLSNVKKFLSVVADMGLPGFSVKDLDEVRVLLSVVIILKLVCKPELEIGILLKLNSYCIDAVFDARFHSRVPSIVGHVFQLFDIFQLRTDKEKFGMYIYMRSLSFVFGVNAFLISSQCVAMIELQK
jgi:hypothetical protein